MSLGGEEEGGRRRNKTADGRQNVSSGKESGGEGRAELEQFSSTHYIHSARAGGHDKRGGGGDEPHRTA